MPAPARRRFASPPARWPSCLLEELGITVFGYVRELGGIAAPPLRSTWRFVTPARSTRSTPRPIRRSSPRSTPRGRPATRWAGSSKTIVTGCPIGLGSHAQWDRKLDARLAAAVMSIQAIKAVEIGLGVEAARRPGSKVMDPIEYEASHPDDDRRFGFRRPTNNAGGIEGGTSNGEPIVVRAAKKPISTLAARGPPSTWRPRRREPAAYERSDVCAVPAASVIVENVVAFEIAAAIVEKYVGTSLEAIRTAIAALHELNRQRLAHWGDGATGHRLI